MVGNMENNTKSSVNKYVRCSGERTTVQPENLIETNSNQPFLNSVYTYNIKLLRDKGPREQ